MGNTEVKQGVRAPDVETAQRPDPMRLRQERTQVEFSLEADRVAMGAPGFSTGHVTPIQKVFANLPKPGSHALAQETWSYKLMCPADAQQLAGALKYLLTSSNVPHLPGYGDAPGESKRGPWMSDEEKLGALEKAVLRNYDHYQWA